MMPLGDGGDRDSFMAGQLIDCSPHGLGMTMSEPIEAGRQVLVRLKMDRSVLLVYTIRYCIPVTPTQYRAGRGSRIIRRARSRAIRRRSCGRCRGRISSALLPLPLLGDPAQREVEGLG